MNPAPFANALRFRPHSRSIRAAPVSISHSNRTPDHDPASAAKGIGSPMNQRMFACPASAESLARPGEGAVNWPSAACQAARALPRVAVMIIAVDGPTASGKGTIAKALAAQFGLPHLDTGLLYRAVGRQVALKGGDPDSPDDALAACAFADSLLADNILRSEETGGLASRVSVHPQVRRALFERQRAFATRPGGAVLDGRDIGTVIAPDAEVKLFVTASVTERAHRRWLELQSRGIAAPLIAIEHDIATRDARDIGRTDSPLRPAPDALVIDTTSFNREQAIEAVIEAVRTRLG